MNTTFNTLEFDKILTTLAEYACSQRVKNRILDLKPYLDEFEVYQKTKDTTEAKLIIETLSNPPLTTMDSIDKILGLLGKDCALTVDHLTKLEQFLNACRRMKVYLNRAEYLNVDIATYGASINPMDELYNEINRSIRNGAVSDTASTLLRDIRRSLEGYQEQIKNKLENMLRTNKKWYADNYYTIRNGHFTLPVKSEFKNQVNGSVIDKSQTGSTFFIEPTIVNKLQGEILSLKIDEENEVIRILYTLTDLVEKYSSELNINVEAIEILDFIFAKAKLSIHMKSIPVPINTNKEIIINQGRHPLLNEATAIPLDFRIGVDGITGVIITGPNTGGKTVALKTVGLLSLMAQSGLHVPVKEGSKFSMHNIVLCDIGDGQSITENLSTFSSHITNIISIIESATFESLVLLDELGSGTDPNEGMGIAVAILEELKAKKCLIVATTHYPEVKIFTQNTPGFINARMTFDRENLKPEYKLEIGEAGESCALYISKRLGLPIHMVQRAYHIAYGPSELTSKPELSKSNYDIEDISEVNKVVSEVLDEVSEVKKHSQASLPNIIKRVEPKPKISTNQTRRDKFSIGDSVIVYPQKLTGIIYTTTNEKGELGVQIKGKKQFINHKRLQLRVAAKELYPEDYDFSTIFDSVEKRKATHVLSKRYDPNIVINHSNTDL
jgi:dsDNA-specific endonuclease/ATPase MutS2